MALPVHARAYVGGGNIAGILGLSPFRTPLDEYHGIMGTSAEITERTQRFFDRRKALEPFVLQVLRHDLKLDVTAINERYTHPTMPHLRAEIDAEITTARGDENCEFKTVHPNASKAWGDDAPMYVVAQAMFGLGIRPKERGLIVGAVGFDSQKTYPLYRDEGTIDAMLKAGDDFWVNHILAEVPPAPMNVEDVLAYIVPDANAVLELDDAPGLRDAVDAYREANEDRLAAEKIEEARAGVVKLAMAEKSIITHKGKQLFSWKQQMARRFDITAFREAHPTLAEQFMKDSISRVARFSKAK